MQILGLSCFYHDAAACLLRDGILVAACQEERFSRVKHDWRFPSESIRFCLEQGGISAGDIDAVCFYEKPFLKFERVLETFLSVSPRGYRAFLDTIPSWLHQKLRLPGILRSSLEYGGTVLYAEHHLAHAASAYYPSPFEDAAVLTVDGVGEWATASYGQGRGAGLSLTHEMRFPHSLGLLYSAVTAYLGFAVNNDEYKVMGMAPYGEPVHRDRLLRQVVHLNGDGSIRLDLDFFSFQFGRRMYDRRRFTGLFGVPPRTPGGEITQQHYDIAASLQRVTEEVVLAMAAHVQRETGSRNLCLAGGVSLNSVANGRLLREGPFDAVYVQPASGDAGGAVGAAYAAYHLYAGREDRHSLADVYLGTSAGRREITACLDAAGMAYRILPDGEVERETARLLAAGKVVGWYQGRMEFGPRALGNRSILADPRRPDMKDLINRKIKFREGFRPFAPAVCEEDAGRYFGIDRPSPYMLFTVPVRTGAIPAVTHVDGSARVQTVNAGANPRFHRLIREFGLISGVPVVLNTSLNIKGEPIARTPDDAVRCFTQSDMDALVMENVLIVK